MGFWGAIPLRINAAKPCSQVTGGCRRIAGDLCRYGGVQLACELPILVRGWQWQVSCNADLV